MHILLNKMDEKEKKIIDKILIKIIEDKDKVLKNAFIKLKNNCEDTINNNINEINNIKNDIKKKEAEMTNNIKNKKDSKLNLYKKHRPHALNINSSNEGNNKNIIYTESETIKEETKIEKSIKKK